MKRNKKNSRILRCIVMVLGLSLLCMNTLGMTAFAYGSEELTEGAAETAAETETETTEPADTAPEMDVAYTVAEDGSITITIGGVEWTLEAEGTEESATTGKVVTQGSRLSLRTGAGMGYEVIDQLRPGEEVTVIGTEGDWYQVIVSEKTGYVHSDYLELYEAVSDNDELDTETLKLMLSLLVQGMVTEEDDGAQSALTPEGNLTLNDDLLQSEGYVEDELQEKQFITVQSKNGNYFYLVIDRSGETENVYFLNLVDEADLLALMEDGENVPVCSCTDHCEAGAVNTACEVCKTNMTECAGTVKATEPEPTTEPVEEPAEEPTNNSGVLLVVLLLAAGGGGALYWFKFRKEKPSTKGPVDLDDYDYGDEDGEDYETEPDDAEEPDDETM